METQTSAARTRGEWLAMGGLLLPWYVLSALLPVAHLVAAFSLLGALGCLLAVAVRWSRMRAAHLGLDVEAWGLAAVLSLGYSMLLIIGSEGRSGFEAMCGECGTLQEARAPFCYACGAA